jgi:hypothetical protein
LLVQLRLDPLALHCGFVDCQRHRLPFLAWDSIVQRHVPSGDGGHTFARHDDSNHVQRIGG